MVAKGTGPKPAITSVPDDPVPQVISLRTDPLREDERADLFEINGTMYSICTRPRVNSALRYLHISRTQGTEAGIDYMLGELLGTDAYEALMDFRDLTEDDLKTIITVASRIMAGAVEDPKGKRKSG